MSEKEKVIRITPKEVGKNGGDEPENNGAEGGTPNGGNEPKAKEGIVTRFKNWCSRTKQEIKENHPVAYKVGKGIVVVGGTVAVGAVVKGVVDAFSNRNCDEYVDTGDCDTEEETTDEEDSVEESDET